MHNQFQHFIWINFYARIEHRSNPGQAPIYHDLSASSSSGQLHNGPKWPSSTPVVDKDCSECTIIVRSQHVSLSRYYTFFLDDVSIMIYSYLTVN